ncbi:MAG: ATP-binding cassette domain-containing protein [Clostridiales bacterium]|nr:ATP-binding cassette domain-containing protein [Clostridiales bacterium]
MPNSDKKQILADISHISFSYDTKPILQDISLTIQSGERIGIVGESGCGKSTLLKILAGLLPPSSGSVNILGKSVPSDIRKNVSVVMQSAMLLPMTICENITLGHDYSEDSVRKVLGQVSLLEWVDSLPDGIHTYLGDRADELSGGQAQRLAIARAMCKEAPLLLLDEPTASLDASTAASVMASLDACTTGSSRNLTIVHVTHQVEYLKGYDRILRMEGGKLYV